MQPKTDILRLILATYISLLHLYSQQKPMSKHSGKTRSDYKIDIGVLIIFIIITILFLYSFTKSDFSDKLFHKKDLNELISYKKQVP